MRREKPSFKYYNWDRVAISEHAAERFICRSIEEDLPVDLLNSGSQIRELLKHSRPIQPRKNFQAMALANNGFKNARYRYFGGWVFVIKDNVILTMYRNELGKNFTFLGGKTE